MALVTQSQVHRASVGTCVCACRHVLPGEAAMTQQHALWAYLCGCACVCRHQQSLLPPRGWGKRL